MNTSTNNYAAAEVVLLGNAQDVICGATKGLPFDDCPNQGLRTVVLDDVE